LIRTKLTNDFDEEVRNLREYDLSWEVINKDTIIQTSGSDKPKDMVMLLAKVPDKEVLEE
jgi:hypothetical protein